MMAADISLFDDQLSIEGTRDADIIAVDAVQVRRVERYFDSELGRWSLKTTSQPQVRATIRNANNVIILRQDFDPKSVRHTTINSLGGHDTVHNNTRIPSMIEGGSGNDLLVGGGDVDIVFGGLGEDDIYGLGGDDRLFGNDGDDILAGGAGVDELFGNDDNDTLIGGSSGDSLFGGRGDDTMEVDFMEDLEARPAWYLGSTIANRLDLELVLSDSGSHGADVMFGSDGNDFMHGNGSDDEMHGGSGDDDLYGDIGNDKLYGDSGHDYLHGGRGGYPRPSSFEPLSVDFGSDELHGGDGKDRLWGQSGNDVLHGGRGVDYLIGGAVMSPLRHAPQLQILRHAFTQRLRVAGGVTV